MDKKYSHFFLDEKQKNNINNTLFESRFFETDYGRNSVCSPIYQKQKNPLFDFGCVTKNESVQIHCITKVLDLRYRTKKFNYWMTTQIDSPPNIAPYFMLEAWVQFFATLMSIMIYGVWVL